MSKKVLYHDNCKDGFASAFLAWRQYGNDAEYIPMKFGSDPNAVVEYGDSVYIFDLNFPRDILLTLYDRCESLLLFDHHESHAAEIRDLHFVTIDFNECGASLAWKHFNGNGYVNPLIQYVKDRDLWEWKLPHSKEVNAYINTFPHDMVAWNVLYHGLENYSDGYKFIVDKGKYILNYQQKIVSDLVDTAYFNLLFGYRVPMVNSPIFQSEIGSALIEKHPDVPFVVIFNVLSNGNKKYSLRSGEDGLDVGKLAKLYGGGGHPHAAGLLLPFTSTNHETKISG